MAINVVSVQYNGWFLPDIILYYSVDSIMLIPSGNPIICHEEVLSLQPMFPTKRFDNFSRCLVSGECSEGLDAFRYFFKNQLLTSLNASKGCPVKIIRGAWG